MVKFLQYCFPSKIVATVFWIGFLPDWNRHWAAALSIVVAFLVILATCGLGAALPDISLVLILLGIYCLLLALVAVPIFRRVYPHVDEEKVVIDAFTAQVIFLGLCTPAVQYINIGVVSFSRAICSRYMVCSEYLYQSTSLVITLLMPYAILRFFDIMEFWPTSNVFLRSKNSTARTLAGIAPAVYSVLFLYLISFLFFSLTMVDMIEFYRIVFKNVYVHFATLGGLIYYSFTKKNFYIAMRKIGVIKLLDHYGLINQQFYEVKYFG